MRHIFLNRRGIEEVPLKLIVGILFLALLIGITFHQIGVFLDFGARKNFADDVLSVFEAMDALQSSSGYGGFSAVKVKVPTGYNATFYNDTNKIVLVTPGETLELNPPGRLLNRLDLAAGSYTIVVYYGRKAPGSVKPFEICFE